MDLFSKLEIFFRKYCSRKWSFIRKIPRQMWNANIWGLTPPLVTALRIYASYIVNKEFRGGIKVRKINKLRFFQDASYLSIYNI